MAKPSMYHFSRVTGRGAELYSHALFGGRQIKDGANYADFRLGDLDLEIKTGSKAFTILGYQQYYFLRNLQSFQDRVLGTQNTLEEASIPIQGSFFDLMGDSDLIKTAKPLYYAFIDRKDTLSSSHYLQDFGGIQLEWGDIRIVPAKLVWTTFFLQSARRKSGLEASIENIDARKESLLDSIARHKAQGQSMYNVKDELGPQNRQQFRTNIFDEIFNPGSTQQSVSDSFILKYLEHFYPEMNSLQQFMTNGPQVVNSNEPGRKTSKIYALIEPNDLSAFECIDQRLMETIPKISEITELRRSLEPEIREIPVRIMGRDIDPRIARDVHSGGLELERVSKRRDRYKISRPMYLPTGHPLRYVAREFEIIDKSKKRNRSKLIRAVNPRSIALPNSHGLGRRTMTNRVIAGTWFIQ